MAERKPLAEGPGEFHIFVNTTPSKQYKVLVSPHQTVQDLMYQLEDLDSSMRFAMGKLIYRNKQLKGKETLRQCGITPNSIVEYERCFPDVLSEMAGFALDIESTGRDFVRAKKRVSSAHFQGSHSGSKAWKGAEALWSPEEMHSLRAPPPVVPTQETSRRMNLGSRWQRDCCVSQEPVFPEVMPTIMQVSSKHRLKYRAHLPREGVYRCSITGLAFVVNSAVTVTYGYATWTRHLSEDEQDILMPIGPLFHIEVQAGIVKKVFLPHFICLAECGADRPCFIAHFKYEKMTLEKPNLLIPFYAVLENPSFSLLGMLWMKMRSSFISLPVHALVLIFQVLSAANTTLHLYLIPDDKSVQQAIEKQEKAWNSKVIHKPPPLTPLFLGCVYRVTGTNSVEITSNERLTFCYKSPKEQQPFVEIYIKNVEEDIELSITNTHNNVRVWKTLLRSDDIKPPPQKPPAHSWHTPSVQVGNERFLSGSTSIDLEFTLRQLKISDSSDKASESTEALWSPEEMHSLGAPPPVVPTPETSRRMNLGLQWQRDCCVSQEPVFPEVMPTIMQVSSKHRLKYRAHLPREGVYRCSITGLAFVVNSAVTVTYGYATWTRHLSKDEQDILMPAGPLFDIEVEAGVVKKVFLPHFICLAECGANRPCFIARFKSEKMTLELPTLLMPFYAVLENPSFSLLGVLWRKMRSSFGSVPVHALVLIFQVLSAANTTLHLYLIPDDSSVKQAIEKQEKAWNSEVIPKPPPLTPLFFGCVYRVTGTNSVEITPNERLTFCYKSSKEQQPFVEIYIKNVEEDTELSITNTRDNVQVWKAFLRSGDIKPPPQKPPAHSWHTPSGAAFVKKNKTELCSRMAQVPSILLHLRDANVINKGEEEEVLSQDTRQQKNQVLLDLLEMKGPEAQQQLFQILRHKDPYLIADLEKSS